MHPALHSLADYPVLLLVSLTGLIWALWQRPWHLLRRNHLQHAWLGAMVLLALLWTVRASLAGGLVIQLMGATLMVTLFGLPLALLSLFVVNVGSLLGLEYFAGHGWAQFDWARLWGRYVWLALVPAVISTGLQDAIRRLLPHHPFVFILGNGYFTAGLAALGASATEALWRQWTAPRLPLLTPTDEIAAAVILAFGEAFLTGMLVAIFVVYKPQWVVTFSDEEYLRR
jgi:uncharacterized membrane protein